MVGLIGSAKTASKAKTTSQGVVFRFASGSLGAKPELFLAEEISGKSWLFIWLGPIKRVPLR